jgi:signal transduction histidine kinase
MPGIHQRGFIHSIKRKVIVAFILACFALLLAWGVSKIAFRQMLSAVENISAPNDKLRIVDELSLSIPRLDELQKAQALHNPGNYDNFLKESRKVTLTIDTLKQLYTGDSLQLVRIGSLRKLLQDRDRLFVNYLKVREGLINDTSFTDQFRSMNNLVNKPPRQTDSMVVTTEKRTSTTTVYPTPKTPPAKEEEPKGFFHKLFGKRKSKAPPDTIVRNDSPYKIINEEFNTQVDTISTATQDTTRRSLGETMRNMELNRRRKSALFVNREAVLGNANNMLMSQILLILKQVETEAVQQIEANNDRAKNVVNTSVSRINLIVLSFFLLTVILLYFILTDIARGNRYRKEIEQARDEAEYHGKAKQRFLSNMSHEIRTPLQSIVGYAEMMKQNKFASQKDIDAIYHSSGHLMQIVNEVLDYNRIISGKFTFTTQTFNMEALLEEVVSVMRLQADKKSLALLTGFHMGRTDFVEGDPFRLKQILYNLLGNAIKFTYQGAVTLSVSCEEREQDVYFTFTIADTGIGISGQDINLIFNEFEQAEGQGLENRAGTGLGLTISKSLIESQGGSIHVKSEWGKGSAFTFYLRFARVQNDAPAPENKWTAIPLPEKRPKVWILDDDRFILDLCASIFEKNRVPYRSFHSPEELLGADWEEDVRYIFLDIRMPGMNGMELCGLLRQRIPGDVRIYALTAQVMPEEREAILAHHFDGLLMKPFMEKDLLGVLVSSDQAGHDGEDLALEEASEPVRAFDETELDIRSVERMTFGDAEQLSKVLGRFVVDCRHDAADLVGALHRNDHPQIVLLTHRIAGRTAQMGARKLAGEFRLAEMAWSGNEQGAAGAGTRGAAGGASVDDDTTAEDRKAHLRELVGELNGLVELVERKYMRQDVSVG